MSVIIETRALCRTYHMGPQTIRALDHVSLTISKGEFVAVMGPSGSGKSTLMNLLGCLDRPTSGCYICDGVDTSTMDIDDLARIRNRKIGFVFQNFNLLPRVTALGNVELPLVYSRVPRAARHRKARQALHAVGLEERLDHLPSQLSGGQQQRVAIARALVNDPAIIFADEPTGALDSHTGQDIMGLLQALNTEGRTVVIVTHEPEVAAYARRVLRFKDGHLISDEQQAGYAPGGETGLAEAGKARP